MTKKSSKEKEIHDQENKKSDSTLETDLKNSLVENEKLKLEIMELNQKFNENFNLKENDSPVLSYRMKKVEDSVEKFDKFIKIFHETSNDLTERTNNLDENTVDLQKKMNSTRNQIDSLLNTMKTQEEKTLGLKLLHDRSDDLESKEKHLKSIIQTFKGDYKVVMAFKNMALCLGIKDYNIAYLIAMQDFMSKYKNIID